jgi:hypothetical protein
MEGVRMPKNIMRIVKEPRIMFLAQYNRLKPSLEKFKKGFKVVRLLIMALFVKVGSIDEEFENRRFRVVLSGVYDYNNNCVDMKWSELFHEAYEYITG